MYFRDMSNYSFYLEKPIDVVWNIGWLEDGKEYSKGVVDTGILFKLASMLVSTGAIDVHVNRMRGLDPCALSECDTPEAFHEGKSIQLGASEIWVPSTKKGEYFASPSLVYHYMQKHDYLPPKEFLEAIRKFDLAGEYKAQEVYLEQIKGHF